MDWIDLALGLTADELTWWQMAVRALIALLLLIVLVRLGNKRLFAKGSAIDMVVSIMVGSTMAQSIHSPGPVLPVYAATAALIFGHGLLTRLAVTFGWLGPVLKGHRVRLVRDGRRLEENLKSSAITEAELRAALRDNGDEPDLERIQDAWLERDGSISLITADSPPKVVDVSVRDGVQTVRVQIG